MNLQVLGANRTRVNMEGNQVFFSYSTAVAVILKDGRRFRTEKNWSRTTQKHLTEFGLKNADTKPQKWFDSEGWAKPDHETLQFTRIRHDSNGNPRYVCHFLQLNTRAELDADPHIGVSEKYAIAVKRANKIGGRKYHCKAYGGGIVFSSYSLDELAQHVSEVTGRNFKAETD